MHLKAAADVIMMGLTWTATVGGGTAVLVADPTPSVLDANTLVPLGAILACSAATVAAALKWGAKWKGIEKDIESLREEQRYLRKIIMHVLNRKDVHDT